MRIVAPGYDELGAYAAQCGGLHGVQGAVVRNEVRRGEDQLLAGEVEGGLDQVYEGVGVRVWPGAQHLDGDASGEGGR